MDDFTELQPVSSSVCPSSHFYRVERSERKFALGVAAVPGLALFALTAQVMRVAQATPAETLQEE